MSGCMIDVPFELSWRRQMRVEVLVELIVEVRVEVRVGLIVKNTE